MSTCAELFISEFSASIIFAFLLIFNINMYFLEKFYKNLRRLIYILWKRWHNDLMMQFLHYEAYGHLCNERVYVLAWSTLFDDENNLMSCLSLKKSTDIRYQISFLDIFFSRRLLYLQIMQNWKKIWHLLNFRSCNYRIHSLSYFALL